MKHILENKMKATELLIGLEFWKTKLIQILYHQQMIALWQLVRFSDTNLNIHNSYSSSGFLWGNHNSAKQKRPIWTVDRAMLPFFLKGRYENRTSVFIRLEITTALVTISDSDQWNCYEENYPPPGCQGKYCKMLVYLLDASYTPAGSN